MSLGRSAIVIPLFRWSSAGTPSAVDVLLFVPSFRKTQFLPEAKADMLLPDAHANTFAPDHKDTMLLPDARPHYLES
jgi:hypothetical protein